MSRFVAPLDKPITRTIGLGPCRCPGTPHKADEIEVYTQLGWDDLVDIGLAAAQSEGAAQRLLTTRAIASWNLEDVGPDGQQRVVPITEATVRLLDRATVEQISDAVNDLYQRARDPLPNAPGAESPRLPPDAAGTSTSTTPTIETPSS